MPVHANDVQMHLRTFSDADLAAQARRYFKSGSGEYGEGDEFLGIRVPVLRAETKRFTGLSIEEIGHLIKSRFHEERMFALLLLVHQFARADQHTQRLIYEFYLAHTDYINNWDLVDCSAPKIVGEFLKDKNRKPLYKLARSKNLWQRRIAIIATFQLIKASDFSDALAISAVLLEDDEDLIHKAVGWMLREVGNRDQHAGEEFLAEHYRNMPRTMLRYAIEKFPAEKREAYLNGAVSI